MTPKKPDCSDAIKLCGFCFYFVPNGSPLGFGYCFADSDKGYKKHIAPACLKFVPDNGQNPYKDYSLFDKIGQFKMSK